MANSPEITRLFESIKNTAVISDQQSSFGMGELGRLMYGKSSNEEFQSSVKKLENMDIVQQGAVKKRNGFVDDPRFNFGSKSFIAGTFLLGDVVLTNLDGVVSFSDFKVGFFKDIVVVVAVVDIAVTATGVDFGRGGVIVLTYSREKVEEEGFRFVRDTIRRFEAGATFNPSAGDFQNFSTFFGSTIFNVDTLGLSSYYIETYVRGYDTIPSNARGVQDYIGPTADLNFTSIEEVADGKYIVLIPGLGVRGYVPIVIERDKLRDVYSIRSFGTRGVRRNTVATFAPYNSVDLNIHELGFHQIYKKNLIVNAGYRDSHLLTVLFKNFSVHPWAYLNPTGGGTTINTRAFPNSRAAELAGTTGEPVATFTQPDRMLDYRFGVTDSAGNPQGMHFFLGGIVRRAQGDPGERTSLDSPQVFVVGTGRDLNESVEYDTQNAVENNAVLAKIAEATRLNSETPMAYFRSSGARVPFPLPTSAAIPKEHFLLESSTHLVMLANMDEDVLDRCMLNDSGHGYLMVSLGEVDEVKSGETVTEIKLNATTVLAEVHSLEREFWFMRPTHGQYNSYLVFRTNAQWRTFGLGGRLLDADNDNTGMGFLDFDSMWRYLSSVRAIHTVSVPSFNLKEGFGSHVTSVEGRTVFSGFRNNKVMMSMPNVPFGFSVDIPFQMQLDNRLIQQIRMSDFVLDERIPEGETDEQRVLRENLNGIKQAAQNLIPSGKQDDTDDYVYYYILQTGGENALPIIREEDTAANEKILWAIGHRQLTIGTSREERFMHSLQGGPLIAGRISSRGFQSARGSGLSLVVKGDYSLFFIGPDKRTVFYSSYRETVSGLRSRDSSVIGGRVSGDVLDIKWDYIRKALWVLYEGEEDNRKISLFFLSQEYKIEGWSHYSFGDITTSPWSLFQEEDGSVGVVMRRESNFHVVRFPIEGSYVDTYTGITPTEIVSKVDFWRVPPQGRKGLAILWEKEVGKTHLLMQDVTKLRFPKIDEEIVYNEVYDKGGITVGEVGDFVESGQFPVLRVEHRKNEAATFLAVASRYEILEE